MMEELSAVFVRTNVVLSNNFIGSQSDTDDIFQDMHDNQVGQGQPDTCVDCTMWGDDAFQGITGPTDWRGILPCMMSVEVSEMGLDLVGPVGGYTPTEIYDFWTTLKVSHGFWDRNTFTGTSEQRWDTGILPFIQANPDMPYETAPSVYTQGVDTS